MVFNVYTDGGARGNPGIAGYGWVIYDEKKQLISKDCGFLGIKTNNEAEYLGLIGALTWLSQNLTNYRVSEINFYSDSQLLVRQMQGVYKVKAGTLKVHHQTAQTLLSGLNLPVKFTDIRRQYNQMADSLANQAMDSGRL